MERCPHCDCDAANPNYVRKNVRPRGGDGRSVAVTTPQWYWMIVCPTCHAVLGTINAK